MALTAAQAAPTVLFLVLIVVLLARRVYQSVHGTTINAGVLLGFAGFFVVLFLLTVLNGYLLFPSFWLAGLAIDAVVFVPAVWVGIRYTRRRVEIWRRPDGVWMYRMGMLIAVVYLALFSTRLLIDLFVVGINPFNPPSTSLSLSAAAAVSLLAVDALFAGSTGLFLGRNLGVYFVYRAALGRPNPPSAPPAGPPKA